MRLANALGLVVLFAHWEACLMMMVASFSSNPADSLLGELSYCEVGKVPVLNALGKALLANNTLPITQDETQLKFEEAFSAAEGTFTNLAPEHFSPDIVPLIIFKDGYWCKVRLPHVCCAHAVPCVIHVSASLPAPLPSHMVLWRLCFPLATGE